MRITLVALLLLGAAWAGWTQEVRLGPVPAEDAGDWAQALVPLRLRSTPTQDVQYDGPPHLLSQWGEVSLGTARYTILLGIQADGRADLWVDSNRDRKLSSDELWVGVRGPGYVEWEGELRATPAGGEPFPYPLAVVWPEGRGYVYLVGGAPRGGEFAANGKVATFVLVDGDLDGVYGTKGDFYAVDVDGDGIVHGDPDGHERFALGEGFTLGEKSYRLSQIDPGGSSVRLVTTGYVPPKPPLLPGFPAPELQFDTFPDGEPFALSGLRGKVVLVDFWATWCGPCMDELPLLLELHDMHAGDGFEIVGLSLDTSERDLRAVLSQRGVSWPIGFEGKSWDNPLAQLYRVYQIPTSYLVDRDGIIRYRDLHGAELADRIVELLSVPAEPVPVETRPVTLPVVGPPRPILEIHAPAEVGLGHGEGGVLVVGLVNTAPYEAEEVRVTLTGLPTGVTALAIELAGIPAFGEREVRIPVETEGAVRPTFSASIELLYHYCIGDACFQIQDTAPVTFAAGEARPQAGAIPAWWFLIALGAVFVAALLVRGKLLSVVGLVLVGVAAASLVVGVLRGQATQAWRIGSVLCTSCVGIEEVKTEEPALTAADRDAVTAFPRAAHLVVFYTPWCKSCPYAKALVAELARLNPRIGYEIVDADQSRSRAEASGIVQSGRVIVPAILVVETGRVLFGTSGLASRILAALEEIR